MKARISPEQVRGGVGSIFVFKALPCPGVRVLVVQLGVFPLLLHLGLHQSVDALQVPGVHLLGPLAHPAVPPTHGLVLLQLLRLNRLPLPLGLFLLLLAF